MYPVGAAEGPQYEDHGGDGREQAKQAKRTPEPGFSQIVLLAKLPQVGAVLTGLELEEVLHAGHTLQAHRDFPVAGD